MNTTNAGNELERKIHDLFRREIDEDRFWAKKTNCRLYWKKKYYSKLRESEIIFDLAIEIWLPNAQSYSMLVLIECKNYTHSVPIDDAEEFFGKVQQVALANVKAVIVSTADFQKSTLNFAKSTGIGLIRYFDPSNFKWVLQRSPSAYAPSDGSSSSLTKHIDDILSQPNYKSDTFDLYLRSANQGTNSLWNFIDDLVRDSDISSEQISQIINTRSRQQLSIPFLSKPDIEERCAEILSDINYTGGKVSLEAICERERVFSNLIVETDVIPVESSIVYPALGCIIFEPLQILIYKQTQVNHGQERFTLAHELAHHLLDHAQFMKREYCDERDFALGDRRAENITNIARLEFQANYFASTLLMPYRDFLTDFLRLSEEINLPNKGFGCLYVDNQPCNQHNYMYVTTRLKFLYGVSRKAVDIRLEGLGLLKKNNHHSNEPRQFMHDA